MNLKGLLADRQPAVLTLADGSVFHGVSVGASGYAVGEVVFNTAMTGYQEILTDPSYAEQMVTLTYPHIGNVGINSQDEESRQIWAAALIIRELSPLVSNWRAEQSLESYLKSQGVVAIADIDTRRLTRLLREKGAQNGCIITRTTDPEAALQKAKDYGGIIGADLAKVVSTTAPKVMHHGSWHFHDGKAYESEGSGQGPHIVVYDFGVKQQILRLLVDRGCRLTLVPAQTSVQDVLAYKPDGVFLSNGPGDPAACDYAIANIKELLALGMPLFGICLGFQLLALACGASTIKMKFGHHGANHPVIDVQSKQVMITSQNHSFAVDEQSLPRELKVTHRSLFDQSLQGIYHIKKPAMAFQGHPEASPGPHDIERLFDEFVTMATESSWNKNKRCEYAKANRS